MEDEEPLKEQEKKPINSAKLETFRVIKAFTLDKHYPRNSYFTSSDKQIIKKLSNENYIN